MSVIIVKHPTTGMSAEIPASQLPIWERNGYQAANAQAAPAVIPAPQAPAPIAKAEEPATVPPPAIEPEAPHSAPEVVRPRGRGRPRNAD